MSRGDSHYGFQDEPPPKRRHVPMPGAEPSNEDSGEHDEPAESLTRRVLSWDPFPVILIVSALVWVGLGLAARKWPTLGFVLVAAGLLVCLLSQIYLYVSIALDNPEAGLWSFLFDWYRLFHLYRNPELTWRPTVIAIIGLLMCLTGIGVFLTRAR